MDRNMRNLRRILWLLCFEILILVEGDDSCGSGVPVECICVRQQVLCTGSTLKTFPNVSLLPWNTTKIALLNTDVETIPTEDLMMYLFDLEELDITNSKVTEVEKFVAEFGSKLITIILEGNQINKIASGAFDDLNELIELSLRSNRLQNFPEFLSDSKLTKLFVNNNPIKAIPQSVFEHLPDLFEVDMSYTQIQELPGYIFNNTQNLYKLDLSFSSLSKIDDNAFVGGSGIRQVYLDSTSLSSLPTKGLTSVEVLSLKDVRTLWQIPKGLNSLQKVTVSKSNSFLCCAFFLGEYLPNHGRYVDSAGGGVSCPPIPTEGSTEPSTDSTTEEPTTDDGGWGGRKRRDIPEKDAFELLLPNQRKLLEWNTKPFTNIPSVHTCGDFNSSLGYVTAPPSRKIECYPEPDAFNPCENVMGADWLTAVSFIIGLSAIVGNLIVLIVILTGPRRLTVAKFLMCNLAFADLCLGLYIFILVCSSISTSGEYYNHIRTWQFGYGCQITGFLAVFSSLLSLFTLAVITVERFITIVYAMDLNFRLRMGKTAYLMTCGWIFAFTMAILPIVGVSSYSKVAICLPFEVETVGDMVFLSFILVLSTLVFVGIMICYIRMYLVVSSPNTAAPHRNDATVAKRMAVLVFTDFVCWFPIALFGLLTAFGHSVIGVTESKYLLVFFFPLNSCCNPFFYAIMTKSFRREFYGIMSRFGFCHKHAIKHNKSGLSTLTTKLRFSNSKDIKLQSTYKKKEKPAVIPLTYKECRSHSVEGTPETPTNRERIQWSEEIPLAPVAEHNQAVFPNPRYQLKSGSTSDYAVVPETPESLKDEASVWDDDLAEKGAHLYEELDAEQLKNGHYQALMNSKDDRDSSGDSSSEVQVQVHRHP